MQEAWIRLQCPGCGEQREANPADLPAPDTDYSCESCGGSRPLAEFAKTSRDLEILEQFHAS